MIGRNRVVITGLGVLAANGTGKEAFWNSLLAGESGIGPITQFDASDLPWRIAGEISDFAPEDFINRSLKPKRQSRNTQIAAAATTLALADAGLSFSSRNLSESIPIVLGISLGGLDLVEQHTRRLVEKGMNKGLPTVSACVHIIAPSFISSMLGINADIQVISNSCTGGLDAIAEGARLISEGRSDIAIAGGTDAVVIPSVVTGLGYAGMLSPENDPPDEISRPFDIKRTGGVISEGSGVIILESLEHALDRGAEPYAEVIGYGAASNTNIPPTHGLELSMRHAIENAGLTTSDIDYIHAHGSSDVLLDIAETQAIRTLFKDSAYNIPINSIKGATGNPLAAGGPLQIISSALSLSQGVIPSTINHSTPDPECDLDYVPNEVRYTNAKSALINSHGTGGVNSSLLIKKI